MVGFLDFLGMVLGFLYLYLELRESALLWVIGLIMPAIYGTLLIDKGIYGDALMEIYYFFAGVYGLYYWLAHRVRTKKALPITHLPRRLYLRLGLLAVVLWAAFAVVLSHILHSTVPVLDAFTTALSIVALWLLSRKYVEQWLVWLLVDAMSTYLYVRKGLPFRAVLYGAYTIISIIGYRFWLRRMTR